jgi:phosphonoacetaldehyde hydrolase
LDVNNRATYQNGVKAVILDWAGTSVDFGSFAPTAVLLRLFDQQGVPIYPEEARANMGLMKKDHIRSLLAQPRIAEAWRVAYGAAPSEADVEHLFVNFVPKQRAVLKDYATPIPGLLETVEALRERGIKIGSTTGYTREMMDVLVPEAAKFGYKPDCIVCPDEAPAGRPYPWMCYLNAIKLGVYPMETLIKIGDTLPDVEEGMNAGVWTVGIALTGNLLGKNHDEFNEMSQTERDAARQRIAAQLKQAGAHYVIDGIWGLLDVISEIEERLSKGEHPYSEKKAFG